MATVGSKARARGGWGLVLAALLLRGPGLAGQEIEPDSPAGLARRLLDEAARRMGTPARVEAAGGLWFRAEGVLDKAAEGQGYRPGHPSPGPFREELAVGPEGEAVAWSYREDRYDGTWETVREIRRAPDRRIFVAPDAGFSVVLVSPDHVEGRRRLLRRFPPFLLDEVRRAPEGPVRIGGDGAGETVTGRLASGREVELRFDPARGVLTGATYRLDLEGRGDAEVAWEWRDFREVPGVGLLPHRYAVSVAGEPYTAMRVTAAGTGADPGGILSLPGGAPSDTVHLPAGADPTARAGVRTVAPGVHQVLRLRTGFHPLFVEVGDFVVAVDAPAGFHVLGGIPAEDVSPVPTSDRLSRRYLELVEETTGKPVRYVVLTHAHHDHAGGVRAFVAAGATVVAHPHDTAFVRGLVEAPHTVAPDALSRSPRPLRMQAVEGRWSVASEAREVEVIDVGPNPHGSHNLVVRVPDARLLFVSDLLDPTSDPERFPVPSHAALDRWFLDWLAGSGLDDHEVYTMHGAARALPEILRAAEPREGGPEP